MNAIDSDTGQKGGKKEDSQYILLEEGKRENPISFGIKEGL